MSRDIYSGQSQRSPKPSRREMPQVGQASPSKNYPSSVPQPSPRSIPIVSPSQTRKSRHIGGSRSSNSSPLTLPSEGHVPHSLSSGAFNVSGGYYGDELSSPIMDTRSASAPGHHRSRSTTRGNARNYHSLERDHEREFMPIREPRERSLDRGDPSHHHRTRDRSLDRLSIRDDGLDHDPYRDPLPRTRQSPNPDLGLRHSIPSRDRDSYIIDMQNQLSEMQKEYNNLKKELDITNQKLGSSMHSIKTFWSPELKKERALRKEESAKYSLINDQLKLFNSENQKQATLIHQLEDELRNQQLRNPDIELQQQLEQLYAEKQHQAKEIYLLRETIKEMELRIETQKQTLQAREESIKKLLEMLQTKGAGGKLQDDERLEYERMKTQLFEAQARARHLEGLVESKDKDLLKTKEESRIKTLEKELALMETELKKLSVVKSSGGTVSPSVHENIRSTDSLQKNEKLKSKMEELRMELQKRDQEILAMGAKMRTLEEQHQDYQRHIAVLKESLCAKEEHYNMLQTDVEELRQRLEEKNKLIEKKTQQALQAQQERNRLNSELNELKDHMDIKDRKINVLQRKVELHDANERASASTKGKDDELQHLLEEKQRQLDEQQKLYQEKLKQAEEKQKQTEEKQRKLEERQKALEEMEKRLRKRKEKLDGMEAVLQKAEAGQNEVLAHQIAELRKRNEELEKKTDNATKEVQKAKDDAARSQNELDRLLEILKQMEDEKFAKDQQIQDLQNALKDREAKLGALKRTQQSEKAAGSQAMEESRRREEDARKEASRAQIHLQQQNERVEELEEALRESIRITAEREIALVESQELQHQTEERVGKLEERLKSLQNAYNLQCTNCPPYKKKVLKQDKQLTKLINERKKALEDLFDMKNEALSAAISEKDAHIALIEMSGIKNYKTAEELEALRSSRKTLMEKIKQENEKRVQVLQEWAEENHCSDEEQLNGSNAQQMGAEQTKQS